MTIRLHSDAGDSCLFPPFFVWVPESYHSRCVVSCQPGSSYFLLSAYEHLLFTRCVISSHLAPAYTYFYAYCNTCVWDLSSLTRNQSNLSCIRRQILTTAPPGKSRTFCISNPNHHERGSGWFNWSLSFLMRKTASIQSLSFVTFQRTDRLLSWLIAQSVVIRVWELQNQNYDHFYLRDSLQALFSICTTDRCF